MSLVFSMLWLAFFITCLYCMNEKFACTYVLLFACATHLSRWHSRVCGIVDSVWALWCSFALSVCRSWLEPVFSHTMCKKPAGGLMRLELNCDITSAPPCPSAVYYFVFVPKMQPVKGSNANLHTTHFHAYRDQCSSIWEVVGNIRSWVLLLMAWCL